MSIRYKLELDLENDAVLYRDISGHGKLISVALQDINKDRSVISGLSSCDAYMLGALSASKSFDKVYLITSKPKYKLFILIAIIFTTIFILSNILSAKLVEIFGITITGALLVYPFSYIFDYIMTDIYGYQNARRVIWSTILALVLFNIAIIFLIYLPPSHYWHYQTEVNDVFKRVLRTFVASTIAFSVAFFISSYILQKLKVERQGISLFQRIFRSLLISEIFDTGLFCLLAFYGIWPIIEMLKFILISYLTKVTYEILIFNFITKPIIAKIKHIEQLDIVDTNTNFTPFSWRVDYTDANNLYRSKVD